jgi:2-succinyl-5-enolpyruvyl-6-hydroxy-3-cyclohexene-1-carboxylate synthase
MLAETIPNLVEIFARKGVREAILSPGSRCAPLTLSLVRHPDIHTRTIPDERSAAYIALGIAQNSRRPVILVCTSGTAALNYAPAVTEAFYQLVPLVVITADRPPEWIDQQDGQAIHQRRLYTPHIKANYELPVDTAHPDARWQAERIASEAVNLAVTEPAGPVHINAPFREPFYPESEDAVRFDRPVKVIRQTPAEQRLSASQWDELFREINSLRRVLIVGGQDRRRPALERGLRRLLQRQPVVLLGDVIANLQAVPGALHHADLILARRDQDRLRPDLLITFGQSLISKNLKLFLRAHRPRIHWHLQPAGDAPDTFQSLTRIIRVTPDYFFREFARRFQGANLDNSYPQLWQSRETEVTEHLTNYFTDGSQWSEPEAVARLLTHIPPGSLLHLGNSLPVRYVNYLGLNGAEVEVYANRGTSGIDGTLSTAVGHALASAPAMNIILLGDLAFHYDRNALWNNYVPANLRVVVLNNGGGGIFRVIPGPDRQPEMEEYFVTRQVATAEAVAGEAGLAYLRCRSREELEDALASFFAPAEKGKVLEIFTDPEHSAAVLKQFIKEIGGHHEE